MKDSDGKPHFVASKYRDPNQTYDDLIEQEIASMSLEQLRDMARTILASGGLKPPSLTVTYRPEEIQKQQKHTP